MSEQFEMLYLNDFQGNKNEFFHTSVHTPVSVEHIQCVVQSDVNLNRQVEIIEGWRQLWNFMRDNNVLSAPSGSLYIARHIDANTDQARILTDLSGVETTDIVIGVGASIVSEFNKGSQAVNMLETAFRQLREGALESFFKGVPVAKDYGTPAGVITEAAGTNLTPAIATFSGTELWQAGTKIDIEGTTSAGVFGANIVLPRDMGAKEFGLAIATFLKGWSQSTTTVVQDLVDPTIQNLILVAAFGGSVMTLDNLVVTPVP